MTEKIEVRYEDMEKISGQFGAQAEQIMQMMKNVQAKIDNLRGGGWIGRGSDAFYSEMEGEVVPTVQRLQQALERASQVTQQVSKTMRDAEEDARAPFGVRSI